MAARSGSDASDYGHEGYPQGRTNSTQSGQQSDAGASLEQEARRLVRTFSHVHNQVLEHCEEEPCRPITGRRLSQQAVPSSAPVADQQTDVEALTSVQHPAAPRSVLGALLLASDMRTRLFKQRKDARLAQNCGPRLGMRGGSDHSIHAKTTTLAEEKSSTATGFPSPGRGQHISANFTALPDEKGFETQIKPAPSRSSADESMVEEITDILARRAYILRLCSLMLEYGAPTHRIERNLVQSSRALGAEADFLYMPSVVICTFHDYSTYANNIEIVRRPAGIDCGRLLDVCRTFQQVVEGELTAQQGIQELEAIVVRPHVDGVIGHIIAHGCASVCISPVAFDSNILDFIPIFILGCYVGFLRSYVVAKTQQFPHVFEVFACISVAFVARALGSIHWPNDSGRYVFCFSAMAQSSVVLILPGLPILMSALELQSKNIVSGSVRMTWCIIYILFISFGLMLGTTLFGVIKPDAVDDVMCVNPDWFTPSEYPDYKLIYTRFIWAPLFTCAIARVQRAKWHQIPMMALIATVGNQVHFWVASVLVSNSHVSNTVGSFVIGCMGSLYARYSKHNGIAAAAMMPAVFLQVPGSLASAGGLVAGVASSRQMLTNATDISIVTGGTKGLMAAQQDPESVYSGTIFNVGYSMVQISIGISVGLYMSTLVMWPIVKRGKKTLFSF